ncbi:hypothetical protein C9J85_12240 [Haloferax sp. wsp5]|nr:hypothetical protein C9J85_12240 [Haloferax sp. wsp5]
MTATVEGAGTPTTSTHGGRAVMPDGYTMLGGTGGDADIQCGMMDPLAEQLTLVSHNSTVRQIRALPLSTRPVRTPSRRN